MRRRDDFFVPEDLGDALWKLESLAAFLLDLGMEADFNAQTCRNFSLADDWRHVASLVRKADGVMDCVIGAIEAVQRMRNPEA